VDVEEAKHWNSRGHFFGAAAEAMRRILVESARRKQRHKHGGGMQRLDLDAVEPAVDDEEFDLLGLDDVLSRFEQRWPDKAELVKLRFFAGMTIPDAAEALGVSRATAERTWTFARAWLHAELNRDQ